MHRDLPYGVDDADGTLGLREPRDDHVFFEAIGVGVLEKRRDLPMGCSRRIPERLRGRVGFERLRPRRRAAPDAQERALNGLDVI